MNQNNEVKANNAVEKTMAPLNPTTPAKEPRHAIVPDKPNAESPHVIAKQSKKEGNSVNQNNEVKTNSVVEKPATPPNPTTPAKDPKRVIGPNKSIEGHPLIIAIDHGYGNIKTPTFIFPACIRPSLDEVEQLLCDSLSFEGKHYIIGTGHKEFRHDKIMDEDYYILTLAAIGKELRHRHLTSAEVIIAAGLPLTWADYQHTHFKEYLMKNPHVDFTYLGVDYHVDIKDVFIFSQGVAAIAHRIKKFTGINMLVDIGNGTMNVFNINDKKVIKESFFTEKYGTYQCVILARELLQRHFSSIPMDPQIEKYMCSLRTDMGEKYKTIIGDAAKQYVAEIFRRLREREYDPDLMRLWVTGGGACLVKNFGEFKPDRVIILNDIHANARGYEALAKARLEMGA